MRKRDRIRIVKKILAENFDLRNSFCRNVAEEIDVFYKTLKLDEVWDGKERRNGAKK